MTNASEAGDGREAPRSDDRMTRVGPGTPAGELLRRYWQPVGVASDHPLPRIWQSPFGFWERISFSFATEKGSSDFSIPIAAIEGRHSTTAEWSAQGIRCCYHGWLFDVAGRCLDQPCEPAESTYKERVRQPSYPCREYHGLDLRVHGSSRSDARVSPFRHSRRRRRCRRRRRNLIRPRRRRDPRVQLAPDLRECDGSLPRLRPAQCVQRAAVHDKPSPFVLG